MWAHPLQWRSLHAAVAAETVWDGEHANRQSKAPWRVSAASHNQHTSWNCAKQHPAKHFPHTCPCTTGNTNALQVDLKRYTIACHCFPPTLIRCDPWMGSMNKQRTEEALSVQPRGRWSCDSGTQMGRALLSHVASGSATNIASSSEVSRVTQLLKSEPPFFRLNPNSVSRTHYSFCHEIIMKIAWQGQRPSAYWLEALSTVFFHPCSKNISGKLGRGDRWWIIKHLYHVLRYKTFRFTVFVKTLLFYRL